MKKRPSTRERLAKVLRDNGFDVDPGSISGAVGYYRITKHLDDTTVTWECWATDVKAGRKRHLVSYDTMTACVRYGIEYDHYDAHFTYVFAKESKP